MTGTLSSDATHAKSSAATSLFKALTGIHEGEIAAPSQLNDRLEPRFHVVDDENVSDLDCNLSYRPAQDRVGRISVDLVDLNTSGCAIRYRSPNPIPKTRASSMLEIKNLASSSSIQMLARVCWSRQTGIDQFTSGLYFRRSLPVDLIDNGVRGGCLSRRGAQRVTVDVPVSIRQSQPQLLTRGVIVSTSQTGLQVAVPDALAIGSRLMLQLHDGTAVVGKTVWCSALESGFASGVAFVQVATGRQFDQAVLGA